MQQTSPFEAYALGLLAVLERLPIPVAIAFDPVCERIAGNQAFRRLTDEAAVEAVRAALARAARAGTEVDDALVWAWPLAGECGDEAGAIAALPRLAEERDLQRRYRLIADALPQFVWLDAPDGNANYANARWLRYAGADGNRPGDPLRDDLLHPHDAQRLVPERDRTLAAGEPFEAECRYRGGDGKYRWFLFRSIPLRDDGGMVTNWLSTATDIDKQKRAEEQQSFFARAGDLLGSTLDLSTTLDRIARLAATLGTWCQIDLPDVHGDLRVAAVAHAVPESQRILEELLGRRTYASNAPHGPPAVFATREPQLLARVDEDAVLRVIPDADDRAIYRRVGYESGVIVPLRAGERILGTLGIASDDPSRLYTDFDLATALEFGRRAAIALENAQSFARQHRVATTLQRALLPETFPHTQRVHFSSAYAAAASAQGEAVGGDWYDAFELADEKIAVSMGDVAGHGVEAAVTMSVVRQAIRAAALEDRSPPGVLERANRMLHLEPRVPMTTALFATFDPVLSQLSYAIAGHPPPLIVDDLGKIAALHGTGPPLGLAFDRTLVRHGSAIVPGHGVIIFYTDGLLEYSRDLREAERRLMNVAAQRLYLSESNPAQAIIDAVLDSRQRDDIAVLVLRVRDRRAKRLRVVMPAHRRALPVLRERLRDFAIARGCGEAQISQVLDATDELLADAIERETAAIGNGSVTLHAAMEGEQLIAEVNASRIRV